MELKLRTSGKRGCAPGAPPLVIIVFLLVLLSMAVDESYCEEAEAEEEELAIRPDIAYYDCAKKSLMSASDEDGQKHATIFPRMQKSGPKCTPDYLFCAEGLALPATCPPGLFYDSEKHDCDLKDNVASCLNEADAEGGIPKAPKSKPLTEDTPFHDCSMMPCGFYPDEQSKDGSTYIFCQAGEAVKRTCPAGSAYDYTLADCVPRAEAKIWTPPAPVKPKYLMDHPLLQHDTGGISGAEVPSSDRTKFVPVYKGIEGFPPPAANPVTIEVVTQTATLMGKKPPADLLEQKQWEPEWNDWLLCPDLSYVVSLNTSEGMSCMNPGTGSNSKFVLEFPYPEWHAVKDNDADPGATLIGMKTSLPPVVGNDGKASNFDLIFSNAPPKDKKRTGGVRENEQYCPTRTAGCGISLQYVEEKVEQEGEKRTQYNILNGKIECCPVPSPLEEPGFAAFEFLRPVARCENTDSDSWKKCPVTTAVWGLVVPDELLYIGSFYASVGHTLDSIVKDVEARIKRDGVTCGGDDDEDEVEEASCWYEGWNDLTLDSARPVPINRTLSVPPYTNVTLYQAYAQFGYIQIFSPHFLKVTETALVDYPTNMELPGEDVSKAKSKLPPAKTSGTAPARLTPIRGEETPASKVNAGEKDMICKFHDIDSSRKVILENRFTVIVSSTDPSVSGKWQKRWSNCSGFGHFVDKVQLTREEVTGASGNQDRAGIVQLGAKCVDINMPGKQTKAASDEVFALMPRAERKPYDDSKWRVCKDGVAVGFQVMRQKKTSETTDEVGMETIRILCSCRTKEYFNDARGDGMESGRGKLGEGGYTEIEVTGEEAAALIAAAKPLRKLHAGDEGLDLGAGPAEGDLGAGSGETESADASKNKEERLSKPARTHDAGPEKGKKIKAPRKKKVNGTTPSSEAKAPLKYYHWVKNPLPGIPYENRTYELNTEAENQGEDDTIPGKWQKPQVCRAEQALAGILPKFLELNTKREGYDNKGMLALKAKCLDVPSSAKLCQPTEETIMVARCANKEKIDLPCKFRAPYGVMYDFKPENQYHINVMESVGSSLPCVLGDLRLNFANRLGSKSPGWADVSSDVKNTFWNTLITVDGIIPSIPPNAMMDVKQTIGKCGPYKVYTDRFQVGKQEIVLPSACPITLQPMIHRCWRDTEPIQMTLSDEGANMLDLGAEEWAEAETGPEVKSQGDEQEPTQEEKDDAGDKEPSVKSGAAPSSLASLAPCKFMAREPSDDYSETDGGTILTSPEVSQGGFWGDDLHEHHPKEAPNGWYSCPPNTYVYGINVQRYKEEGDEFGIAHFSFKCVNPDKWEIASFWTMKTPGLPEYTVKPLNKWYECRAGAVAVGFQLNSQPKQDEDEDDVGTDNVLLECSCGPPAVDDMQDDDVFGPTLRGTWTDPRICQPKQALCAFQGQFEHYFQKEGGADEAGMVVDNTGLNNLKGKCCDVKHPADKCVPEEKTVLVGTCDNTYDWKMRSCEVILGVGVKFDNNLSPSARSFYNGLGYTPECNGVVLRPRFQKNVKCTPDGVDESASANNSCKYDWTSAPHQIWREKEKHLDMIMVPAGTKVDIFQIVGKCGPFQVLTNRYFVEDEEKDLVDMSHPGNNSDHLEPECWEDDTILKGKKTGSESLRPDQETRVFDRSTSNLTTYDIEKDGATLTSPTQTDFPEISKYTDWEYCNKPQDGDFWYVDAIYVERQGVQAPVEDLAGLVAIGMRCGNTKKIERGEHVITGVTPAVVTLEESAWDWQKCECGAGVGFEISVVPPQNLGDDISVESMRLKCSCGDEKWIWKTKSEFPPLLAGRKGSWTGPQLCRPREALCGIRTRSKPFQLPSEGEIEDEQLASYDNIGITRVKTKCCAVPNPAIHCKPKESIREISVCDNSEVDEKRKCKISTIIGVTYDVENMESKSEADFFESIGWSLRCIIDELEETFVEKLGKATVATDYLWHGSSDIWTLAQPVLDFVDMDEETRSSIHQVIGECGPYLVATDRFMRRDMKVKSGTGDVAEEFFDSKATVKPLKELHPGCWADMAQFNARDYLFPNTTSEIPFHQVAGAPEFTVTMPPKKPGIVVEAPPLSQLLKVGNANDMRLEDDGQGSFQKKECPAGSYVTGFAIGSTVMEDRETSTRDDLGVTHMSIRCRIPDRKITERGLPINDPGTELKLNKLLNQHMPCVGGVIVGFELSYQEVPLQSDKAEDKYGIDNVRGICSWGPALANLNPPRTEWSDPFACKPYQAVCEVAGFFGKRSVANWEKVDATGLVQLKFTCCDVPSPVQGHSPKEILRLASVCDNTQFTEERICNYDLDLGVTYDFQEHKDEAVTYLSIGYSIPCLGSSIKMAFDNATADGKMVECAVNPKENLCIYDWSDAVDKGRVFQAGISSFSNFTVVKSLQKIEIYQVTGKLNNLLVLTNHFVLVTKTRDGTELSRERMMVEMGNFPKLDVEDEVCNLTTTQDESQPAITREQEPLTPKNELLAPPDKKPDLENQAGETDGEEVWMANEVDKQEQIPFTPPEVVSASPGAPPKITAPMAVPQAGSIGPNGRPLQSFDSGADSTSPDAPFEVPPSAINPDGSPAIAPGIASQPGAKPKPGKGPAAKQSAAMPIPQSGPKPGTEADAQSAALKPNIGSPKLSDVPATVVGTPDDDDGFEIFMDAEVDGERPWYDYLCPKGEYIAVTALEHGSEFPIQGVHFKCTDPSGTSTTPIYADSVPHKPKSRTTGTSLPPGSNRASPYEVCLCPGTKAALLPIGVHTTVKKDGDGGRVLNVTLICSCDGITYTAPFDAVNLKGKGIAILENKGNGSFGDDGLDEGDSLGSQDDDTALDDSRPKLEYVKLGPLPPGNKVAREGNILKKALYCPPRQGFCGVRIQSKRKKRGGVQKLQVHCCSIPDPTEKCKPEDKLAKVVTCDNLLNQLDRVCEFELLVGVSYDQKGYDGFRRFYERARWNLACVNDRLAKKFSDNLGEAKSDTPFNWDKSEGQEQLGDEWKEVRRAVWKMPIQPMTKVEVFQTVGRCGMYVIYTNEVLLMENNAETGDIKKTPKQITFGPDEGQQLQLVAGTPEQEKPCWVNAVPIVADTPILTGSEPPLGLSGLLKPNGEEPKDGSAGPDDGTIYEKLKGPPGHIEFHGFPESANGAPVYPGDEKANVSGIWHPVHPGSPGDETYSDDAKILCEPGSYVRRFGGFPAPEEDKALNEIHFMCTKPSDTLGEEHSIEMQPGASAAKNDPEKKKYPILASGVFIGMNTKPKSPTLVGHTFPVGSVRKNTGSPDDGYTQAEYCAPGLAICGFAAAWGSEGANNVKFLCCSVESPALRCSPTEKLVPAATCDNRKETRKRVCVIKFGVGILYNLMEHPVSSFFYPSIGYTPNCVADDLKRKFEELECNPRVGCTFNWGGAPQEVFKALEVVPEITTEVEPNQVVEYRQVAGSCTFEGGEILILTNQLRRIALDSAQQELTNEGHLITDTPNRYDVPVCPHQFKDLSSPPTSPNVKDASPLTDEAWNPPQADLSPSHPFHGLEEPETIRFSLEEAPDVILPGPIEVELEVNLKTNWMKWVNCSAGKYVNKLQILSGGVKQGDIDFSFGPPGGKGDFADPMGLVTLVCGCATPDGNSQEDIFVTSVLGELPSDPAPKEADPGAFAVGFESRVQRYNTPPHNNMAYTNVKLIPSFGDPLVIEPPADDRDLGEWEGTIVCRPRESICGFQLAASEFDASQPVEVHDNVGISSLRAKCCGVPTPVATCKPKEALEDAASCDNRGNSNERQCAVKLYVGLSYDYNNPEGEKPHLYESTGWTLNCVKEELSTKFGTSLASSKNFDWPSASIEWSPEVQKNKIWYRAVPQEKVLDVGPNTGFKLIQVTGTCGIYKVHTNQFIKMNLDTEEKEPVQFDDLGNAKPVHCWADMTPLLGKNWLLTNPEQFPPQLFVHNDHPSTKENILKFIAPDSSKRPGMQTKVPIEPLPLDKWSQIILCPAGSYFRSISVYKLDKESGGKVDVIGMAAICVKCTDPNMVETKVDTIVHPSFKDDLDNFKIEHASAVGARNQTCLGGVVGMEYQYSPAGQSDTDSFGIYDVRWLCGTGRDTNFIPVPQHSNLNPHLHKGLVCRPRMSMCMIQGSYATPYEEGKDNMGITNLKLACCSVPSPIANCHGTDVLMYAVTCDNIKYNRPRKCKYKLGFGIQYDMTSVYEKASLFYNSVGYTPTCLAPELKRRFSCWGDSVPEALFQEVVKVQRISDVPAKSRLDIYQVVGRCNMLQVFSEKLIYVIVNEENDEVSRVKVADENLPPFQKKACERPPETEELESPKSQVPVKLKNLDAPKKPKFNCKFKDRLETAIYNHIGPGQSYIEGTRDVSLEYNLNRTITWRGYPMLNCSRGHFLTGFTVRSGAVDVPIATGNSASKRKWDNYGIGAIAMQCSNPLQGKHSEILELHSFGLLVSKDAFNDGPMLREGKYCEAGAAIGFTLGLKPNQKSGDDESLESFRLHCSCGKDVSDGKSETLPPGKEYTFWTEPKFCRPKEALCGFTVAAKLMNRDLPITAYDNVGIGNVRTKCCSVPSPIPDLTPEEGLVHIASCDNKNGEDIKHCVIDLFVGLGYTFADEHHYAIHFYDTIGYTLNVVRKEVAQKFAGYFGSTDLFDWAKAATSPIWNKLNFKRDNLTAFSGVELRLYQIVGVAGFYKIRTNRFLVREINTHTKQEKELGLDLLEIANPLAAPSWEMTSPIRGRDWMVTWSTPLVQWPDRNSYPAPTRLESLSQVPDMLCADTTRFGMIIQTPNPINLGYQWDEWRYCPTGTYVRGWSSVAAGKIQTDDVTKEDYSGIVLIAFVCQPPDGDHSKEQTLTLLQPNNQWEGETWAAQGRVSILMCVGAGIGIQAKTQSIPKPGEDTFIFHDTKLICSAGDDAGFVRDGPKDLPCEADKTKKLKNRDAQVELNKQEVCKPRQAICGLRLSWGPANIGDYKSQDGIGVTNLLALCCDVPSPIATCVKKNSERVVFATACDNSKGKVSRSCMFNLMVGIAFDYHEDEMESYFYASNGFSPDCISGDVKDKFSSNPPTPCEEKGCGYDWSSAPAQIWQESITIPQTKDVPAHQRFRIYQVIGECDSITVLTNQFIQVVADEAEKVISRDTWLAADLPPPKQKTCNAP